MLERRIGNGGPDLRIGHRIDGSVRLPGLARSRKLLFNIRRKLGGRPAHSSGSLARRLRTIAARREFQSDSADALGCNLAARLKNDVEIRKDDGTRGGRITPCRHDIEGQGGKDLVRRVLAGRPDIRDRRRHIDGIGCDVPCRIE